MKLTDRSRTLILLIPITVFLFQVTREPAYLAISIIITLYLLYRLKAFRDLLKGISTQLEATRHIDGQLVKDELVDITLDLVNKSAFKVGLISIDEELPSSIEVVEPLDLPHPLTFIGPRAELSTKYKIKLAKEGVWKIDSVNLGLLDAQGLFLETRRLHAETQLHVRSGEALPRFDLGLAEELYALSRKKGPGADYAGTRQYVTGDRFKDIEWKATARLQRLMVKEYYMENSINLILAVDSSSPLPGRIIPSLKEFLRLGLTKSDRVGVVVYDWGSVKSSLQPRLKVNDVIATLDALPTTSPLESRGSRSSELRTLTEMARELRGMEKMIKKAKDKGERTVLEKILPYYYQAREAYRQRVAGEGVFKVFQTISRWQARPALIVFLTDLSQGGDALAEGARILSAWGHRIIVAKPRLAAKDADLERAYLEHMSFERLARKLRFLDIQVLEAAPDKLLRVLTAEVSRFKLVSAPG